MTWTDHTKRAALFFFLSIVALSVVRLVFFGTYRPETLAWTDAIPGLVTGLRVDLKWLAIALLPAWVLLIVGIRVAALRRAAAVAGVAGYAVTALLDVVNFGYYGFYATPVNAVVFGLFQDDTKAIFATLLEDWPVFEYLAAALLLVTLPPVLADRIVRGSTLSSNEKRSRVVVTAVAGTLLLAVAVRGSLGTFPLRQQDFSVSPHPFVNATVPNGPAALHTAFKEFRMLAAVRPDGDPLEGLAGLGFPTSESARDALRVAGETAGIEGEIEPPYLTDKLRFTSSTKTASSDAPQLLKRAHVVFALMESMGREQFETHGAGNDQLGLLEPELRDALLFRKGICIGSGTFPALEGILFDTPLTPLTQTVYGRKPLSVSRIRAYRDAGYRTIFLTSGPEGWRSIAETFPIQGFDAVYGAAALSTRYPQAESGTWGVGDEWMFRYALELLDEADRKGEKLFLVLLSTTNHPPHRVPDGAEVPPVDPARLPVYVRQKSPEDTRAMQQTYRYAANALGRFVRDLRMSGQLAHTVVAATGDHNARFTYDPDGYWLRQMGVPLIFWIPESVLSAEARRSVETDRPVGHRDIFPTLNALILGKTPADFEGRDLLAPKTLDLADSFFGPTSHGLAVGTWGAAILNADGTYECFRPNPDRPEQLVRVSPCTPLMDRMARAAQAKHGLTDMIVRESVRATRTPERQP